MLADLARRDAGQESLDLVERVERLAQEAGGHTVLPRERVVRHAVLRGERQHLFVDPVPARTQELELEHEVERDALLDRVLERRS